MSALSIALTVVIAIVLPSYVILLVRLRPTKSGETPPHPKKASNRSLEKEESVSPKFEDHSWPAAPSPSIKVDANKLVPQAEFQGGFNQALQGIRVKGEATPEFNPEADEGEQVEQSLAEVGDTDFEGCPHKFGHLRSLPKNTSIPSECFGCPKIVDCLVMLKNE